MEDDLALVDLIVEDDGQQPIGVWSLIQRASKLDITSTQAQKIFRSGKQPVIAGLLKKQAEALRVSLGARACWLGYWLSVRDDLGHRIDLDSRGGQRRATRTRRGW